MKGGCPEPCQEPGSQAELPVNRGRWTSPSNQETALVMVAGAG